VRSVAEQPDGSLLLHYEAGRRFWLLSMWRELPYHTACVSWWVGQRRGACWGLMGRCGGVGAAAAPRSALHCDTAAPPPHRRASHRTTPLPAAPQVRRPGGRLARGGGAGGGVRGAPVCGADAAGGRAAAPGGGGRGRRRRQPGAGQGGGAPRGRLQAAWQAVCRAPGGAGARAAPARGCGARLTPLLPPPPRAQGPAALPEPVQRYAPPPLQPKQAPARPVFDLARPHSHDMAMWRAHGSVYGGGGGAGGGSRRTPRDPYRALSEEVGAALGLLGRGRCCCNCRFQLGVDGLLGMACHGLGPGSWLSPPPPRCPLTRRPAAPSPTPHPPHPHPTTPQLGRAERRELFSFAAATLVEAGAAQALGLLQSRDTAARLCWTLEAVQPFLAQQLAALSLERALGRGG
jgi:hypothetical protein